MECICGNKNVHSRECKREKRKKWLLTYNREKRRGRVKEHKCIVCGEDVKTIQCPDCKKILKYYVRCNKCMKKERDRKK